jgi:type VI secretion system secreted protein Hcp
MAFDVFLRLDGIQGESLDAQHRNEIDVLSFAFGAARPGHTIGSGSGAGTGKPDFQDLTFVMRTNKASPTLLQRTADGKHVPSGTLTVRKAGEKQQDYMIIKLSNVLVTSHQTSASTGDDLPVEEVSLRFSKIDYEYKLTDAKGGVGGSFKMSWDLKTNKGG